MKPFYDKYVTRCAARGKTKLIMFGKVWPLERGNLYHIKIDRRNVRGSVIQSRPIGAAEMMEEE